MTMKRTLFTLFLLLASFFGLQAQDLTHIGIKEHFGEMLEFVGKIGSDFDTALDSLRKLKNIPLEIVKEPLEVIFDYDDRLFFGIGYGDCGMYSDVLDTKGYYYLRTWYATGTDYRPFIEEGKVWKENTMTSMAPKDDPDSYLYTFFEGDTIIDGRSCKKMYRGKTPYDKRYYVGAWYEEGRHVYYARANTDQLILFYDFDLSVGDSFLFQANDPTSAINGVVTQKTYIYDSTFKGIRIGIAPYNYQSEPSGWDVVKVWFWREGVGGYRVDNNVDNNLVGDYYWWIEDGLITAACMVGDEVLFFETLLTSFPSFNDGDEIKKNTIDFTHTIKTQPKAPRRDGSTEVTDNTAETESLTGEYSLKELFVNFKPLAGPYVITICDESGTEVYRKEVQTNNVIGLNTDISSYAKGEYTITVENDAEVYTASISIDDAVGIKPLPLARPNGTLDTSRTPSPVSEGEAGAVYDLQGRKIVHRTSGRLSTSTLPRGVYIKDGRKMLVK